MTLRRPSPAGLRSRRPSTGNHQHTLGCVDTRESNTKPVAEDPEFPPPRPYKVGPKEFPHANQFCASLPTTNCNMQKSLLRASRADERASATRKLENSSTSGRRLVRFRKQADRSLLKLFFSATTQPVSPYYRQRRPETPVPRPVSRPRTTQIHYQNFYELNRPRHSYLRRKARITHKHYG